MRGEGNYIACNINSPYINKTGYNDKKHTQMIKRLKVRNLLHIAKAVKILFTNGRAHNYETWNIQKRFQSSVYSYELQFRLATGFSFWSRFVVQTLLPRRPKFLHKLRRQNFCVRRWTKTCALRPSRASLTQHTVCGPPMVRERLPTGQPPSIFFVHK